MMDDVDETGIYITVQREALSDGKWMDGEWRWMDDVNCWMMNDE